MKTPKEMAKALYELLKKDNEDCFDVRVELYDDEVSYRDQAGKVSFDFGEMIITNSGALQDIFGVNTKNELCEDFVNENTISVEFFKSQSGLTHGIVSDQYESYKEMRSVMENLPVCMYLELDRVFE